MIVSALPDPERHRLWPGIRALLAMASRRYGAEPWEPHLLVWVAIDGKQIVGAFTTGLDGEEAEIVNVAGARVREWLPLAEETVSEWARSAGATLLRSRGRKGWARLNARLGWRVAGQDGDRVIYEKAL